MARWSASRRCSDGSPVRFLADRGVLLAAGGFERNRELRQQYQPPMTDEWTRGCPGNTGDALAAGIEIGADTALLDEAWFAPGIVVPDGRPVFYTMVWSGIWVNDAGERFMNERLPYDRAGHEILRLHRATGVSHLPTHWVFDQRQVDHGGVRPLPVDPPGARLVRRRHVARSGRPEAGRHPGGAGRADRCPGRHADDDRRGVQRLRSHRRRRALPPRRGSVGSGRSSICSAPTTDGPNPLPRRDRPAAVLRRADRA